MSNVDQPVKQKGNPGVTGLIILAVIIAIVTIVLIVVATYQNNKTPPPPVTIPDCTGSVNINSLVDLTDPNVIACTISNQYYVGNVPPNTYNFVVAPYSTPYATVCGSYCSTFQNGVCTGTPVNGVSAQTNYDNCIAQLNPSTCAPPLPVAHLGTTLYYPLYATIGQCT